MPKSEPTEVKLKFSKFFWLSSKPYLISFAIIFLVLVSSLIIIPPRVREITKTMSDLDRNQKQLASMTAKLEILKGLDQTEINRRSEAVDQALPNQKELPLILSAVSKLSSVNQLEVLDFQIRPGEIATTSAASKKERLSYLESSILVSGSPRGLKNFLADFSQIAPIFRVKKFKLNYKNIGLVGELNLSIGSPFFPLTLSEKSFDKPLVPLTSEEEEIFKTISHLDFSLFQTGERTIMVPSGRENIFSY